MIEAQMEAQVLLAAAQIEESMGNFGEAEKLYLWALNDIELWYGPLSRQVERYIRDLACFYEFTGRLSKSIAFTERANAICRTREEIAKPSPQFSFADFLAQFQNKLGLKPSLVEN